MLDKHTHTEGHKHESTLDVKGRAVAPIDLCNSAHGNDSLTEPFTQMRAAENCSEHRLTQNVSVV